MKKEDINTLDDLKLFLTDYQEENPEYDCCELVRGICSNRTFMELKFVPFQFYSFPLRKF